MRSKLERTKSRAWKIFSQYIRLRDGRCVSCETGGAENAGHFWHNVLDFDEDNINAQCVRCNKWLSGNLASYSVYLLGKLGKRGFDKLNLKHTRAMKSNKLTIEDYEKIITKYKKKLSILQNKNNGIQY